MKAEELRNLPYSELSEKLDEAKEELFNLRFQLATNQLDNSSQLRRVRRDIARIQTVMREQELEAWRLQQEQEQVEQEEAVGG
ncbi:MAG: 50S ribosomal protein L29 [Acidimicrobiia bacterium]